MEKKSLHGENLRAFMKRKRYPFAGITRTGSKGLSTGHLSRQAAPLNRFARFRSVKILYRRNHFLSTVFFDEKRRFQSPVLYVKRSKRVSPSRLSALSERSTFSGELYSGINGSLTIIFDGSRRTILSRFARASETSPCA